MIEVSLDEAVGSWKKDDGIMNIPKTAKLGLACAQH